MAREMRGSPRAAQLYNEVERSIRIQELCNNWLFVTIPQSDIQD